MHRFVLIFAITASLILAGCASTPEIASHPSTVAPSPSPTAASVTPSPSPTVMSTKEAGEYYLAAVCPSNVEAKAFNSVWTNPNSSLKALKTAAKTGIDVTRNAAEKFEDPAVLWPDSVADDIATIEKQMLADLGTMNEIAHASSLDEMRAVSFDSVDGVAEAGPRVRLRLKLSPDVMADC